MVLRLNGTDSILPGANRNNEIDIWKAASQQGIAPPLLYSDEHNRFLVSTCIDNHLPSHPPLNEAFTNQAFDLLKRCHKLNVAAPNINYASHIEHYWQIIKTKDQSPNHALHQQRKPMQSTLKALLRANTPTGPCHHDLVIANFVGTPNRLYLIDWEYAARGLLVMDYAALSTEWNIDDTTVLARTGIRPELLTKAKALYGYLCKLWQELT